MVVANKNKFFKKWKRELWGRRVNFKKLKTQSRKIIGRKVGRPMSKSKDK